MEVIPYQMPKEFKEFILRSVKNLLHDEKFTKISIFRSPRAKNMITKGFSYLVSFLTNTNSASNDNGEDSNTEGQLNGNENSQSNRSNASYLSVSPKSSANESSSMNRNLRALEEWGMDVEYLMRCQTGKVEVPKDFRNPTGIGTEMIKKMLIDYSTAKDASAVVKDASAVVKDASAVVKDASAVRRTENHSENQVGDHSEKQNDHHHTENHHRPENVTILPNMFHGMLLLADACKLGNFSLERLANNLLNHLLSNEKNCREIMKHCVQDENLKVKTRTATRLLLKFMERKKIRGSIVGDTLEMGLNREVRAASSTILYNGYSPSSGLISPSSGSHSNGSSVALSNVSSLTGNSPFYNEINTVKMRNDPLYGADELSEHEKYLLLSLIGMHPLGKHVISVNFTNFVPGESLERVIETINVKNIGGFSAVQYNNIHKIEAYFKAHKKHLKNIEYLDFEFIEQGSSYKGQNGDIKYRKMLKFLRGFSLKRIRVKCNGGEKRVFDDFLDTIGKETVIEVFDYCYDDQSSYRGNIMSLTTRKIDNLIFTISAYRHAANYNTLNKYMAFLGNNVQNMYFNNFSFGYDFKDFACKLQNVGASCLKSLAIDLTEPYHCFQTMDDQCLSAIFTLKILERLFIAVREENCEELRQFVETELAKVPDNIMREITLIVCRTRAADEVIDDNNALIRTVRIK